MNDLLPKTFLLIALALLSSCLPDNPYLYDRPGFEGGDVPTGVIKNPNPMVKVAPPIYRQEQAQSPKYYQQPYAVEQGYYQEQQAPAPLYYQGQQGVPNPGSRYYSNPYAIPPSGNYRPRYDQDQYYSAPTYYGTPN